MVDFNKEYSILKKELDDAYFRVMKSGRYILGDEVSLFEKEFAKYTGSKFCVGVGNGLDAIQLGLKALGIKQGDEVIVPSNTYIATWIGVSLVGATPVPVEPDEETFNIDPTNIEKVITNRTKAIIPVHLYGQPADMEPILEIAERYNIRILDDAAQAHGAEYKGRKVGSLADVTAFSFYPTKNLGTFGDGGAITTNNEEFSEKVMVLRNYGEHEKYVNWVIGHNSRLDELHASFLRVKLRHLDYIISKKRKIADRYLREIDNREIILPSVAAGALPSWHQFVISLNERDSLRAYLSHLNIDSLIHYPIPPHMQKAYSQLNITQRALPISEKLSEHILSIPISWTMRDTEVSYLISKLNKWIR
jgi:dTDP-4-amino-4,6-dideoxygalactose transaminase